MKTVVDSNENNEEHKNMLLQRELLYLNCLVKID